MTVFSSRFSFENHEYALCLAGKQILQHLGGFGGDF